MQTNLAYAADAAVILYPVKNSTLDWLTLNACGLFIQIEHYY